jgi:spore maturation protein CgeB
VEGAAVVDRHPPVRGRAIGKAARRRVLAQHTYAARVATLEEVLEGCAA